MYRREYLAEVPAVTVARYLSVVGTYLEDTLALSFVEDLPDGSGELPAHGATVEYVVLRDSAFAAFRWTQADVLKESFYVTPEGLPPLVGYCVRPLTPRPEETQATWWSTLIEGGILRTPEHPLPGFLALATLACPGTASLHTPLETHATLASLRDELTYLKELSEEQAEELHQLRHKLQALSLAGFARHETEEVDNEVEDLRELPQWAAEHADEIVLLPRALNGAKKSRYQNPGAVFKGLEFLAGPYRAYRTGALDKTGLDAALAKIRMKTAGSVGATVAGEQGEAYFVTWAGRRRFLEQHLIRGGGRDERYCLRIYFFWDDTSQRAVVGWMTSHLSNSLT